MRFIYNCLICQSVPETPSSTAYAYRFPASCPPSLGLHQAPAFRAEWPALGAACFGFMLERRNMPCICIYIYTIRILYIILHHIIIHYVGWAHVGRGPLFLTQLSSTAWLLASGCRAWRDNLVSTLEVLTCARLRICLRLLMAG